MIKNLIIYFPKGNNELKEQLMKLIYGSDKFCYDLYNRPTTIYTYYASLTFEMIDPLLVILKNKKKELRVEYNGKILNEIDHKLLKNFVLQSRSIMNSGK